MPNWCRNKLILSHDDPELISRVRRTVKTLESRELLRECNSQAPHVRTSVPGLLGEFVPKPPDVANSTRCEWEFSNWGTKQDTDSAILEEDEDTAYRNRRLTIHFDTAWSPPIPWLHRMTELGFTYTMRFYDEGGGFAGIATNANPSRTDECMAFDIDSPLFEEIFGMPWRKWYGYPDDDGIDQKHCGYSDDDGIDHVDNSDWSIL